MSMGADTTSVTIAKSERSRVESCILRVVKLIVDYIGEEGQCREGRERSPKGEGNAVRRSLEEKEDHNLSFLYTPEALNGMGET